MRRTVSCAAWLAGMLLVAGGAARAEIPSPKGSYRHLPAAGTVIEKTKIADGVWQFTVERDSYVRVLNVVAILDDDGVTVFDTSTRPSTARLIVAEIRKLTPKPVRFVINSHWHPDHWSGNEVFAQAYPGVQIVATEATRKAMENTAALWAPRYATQLRAQQEELKKEIASGKRDDGTPLTPELRRADEEDARDYAAFAAEGAKVQRVLPNVTYVDHLDLHRPGREIHLLSMTGDAEGTTVLWLPREKVLVTGDVVSYPIPYISKPMEQARSLRALAAMHAGVIVPGHGPAFHDNDYVELEAELAEKIASGVQAALRRGAETLEEIQKEVTVDELRPRFTDGDPELERRYRDRVSAIVKNAVREARGGTDL